MLGVKDIAFINSTLVFSLMHLFLTETDLDSVVTEINISKKIQKWSDRATSLMTMDEMFRPLLMSKSRVCPRLCVGPCTCWIRSKVFKTVTISFVVLISALSMWILKSPAIAKQSNSEEIIDNSSVNSSTKAGEYFGYSSGKNSSPRRWGRAREDKKRSSSFYFILLERTSSFSAGQSTALITSSTGSS